MPFRQPLGCKPTEEAKIPPIKFHAAVMATDRGSKLGCSSGRRIRSPTPVLRSGRERKPRERMPAPNSLAGGHARRTDAHKVRRARRTGPKKSDSRTALELCEACARLYRSVVHVPSPAISELRSALSRRRHFIRIQTAEVNAVKRLVARRRLRRWPTRQPTHDALAAIARREAARRCALRSDVDLLRGEQSERSCREALRKARRPPFSSTQSTYDRYLRPCFAIGRCHGRCTSTQLRITTTVKRLACELFDWDSGRAG